MTLTDPRTVFPIRPVVRWGSVRLRLTLWNVGVLALVLGGFGVALGLTMRAWLNAGVDQDLALRGEMTVGMWMTPRPPRPPHREFQPRNHEVGSPDPRPTVVGENSPPEPPEPAEPRRPQPPWGNGRGFFFRPPAAVPVRDPSFEGPRFMRIGNADLRGFLPPGVPTSAYDDRAAWLAVAENEGQYATILMDGEPVRLYSVPVNPFGKIIGVAQVAHPLGEQERLLAGFNTTLLMLIPLALGVAGIGGAFLTGRALRPVRQVTQAASLLGADDLSQRLPVGGDDEFSELATTFNGMLGRLEEAFRQLEQAYEQQRRFAGDASHELRTPLTVLKANTSLALAGERSAAEYREALVAANEAADTMSRIVGDLLLLVRSDGGQLQLDHKPLALSDVLRRAAAVLPLEGGPTVRFALPDPPPAVLGDAHHLARLFGNLLENSVRHTPPTGQVAVLAEQTEDIVRIRVADTGEGIPPEHVPHVFERFYRVDAARTHARHGLGGGTGLGLAICKEIATAHGGSIEIRSAVGRGTAVTVTLPAAAVPVAPVLVG